MRERPRALPEIGEASESWFRSLTGVVDNACMSPARRMVEEYTALLTRAFNGAIEVDGQRIVAHPSGTLVARPTQNAAPAPVVVWHASVASDQDNDWSDV